MLHDHDDFKVGEVVVCRGSRGYQLTVGKEYTILDYQPKYYDSDSAAGFTWPAYIGLLDDYGVYVQCHAHRFTYPESEK